MDNTVFLSEPNCLLDDVFTQQVFCTISAARRSIRLPGVSSTAVSCTFLRFAHLACRAGSLKFVQSAQIVCVFQCFKDHVMSVIFYMSTCLVCFSRLSHLCVARHGLPPFSGPIGTASDEVVLLKMARKTLRTPAWSQRHGMDGMLKQLKQMDLVAK